MASLATIETTIHQARIENTRGNVDKALVLYTDAMNMIDTRMEEQISSDESQLLTTYLNNVFEEFERISNSRKSMDNSAKERNEQQNPKQNSLNQPESTPAHSQQLRVPMVPQPVYSPPTPSQQQCSYPSSSVCMNPNPQSANYLNPNYYQYQQQESANATSLRLIA